MNDRKMTPKEKTELMIRCLELARDEMTYAEVYNFDNPAGRCPNGTLIRESLKMVGRLANITAKEVTLTPYCDSLYKEQEKL